MLKKSLLVGVSGAVLGALFACSESSDSSSVSPIADNESEEVVSSSSKAKSSSSQKAKSSSSQKGKSSSSQKAESSSSQKGKSSSSQKAESSSSQKGKSSSSQKAESNSSQKDEISSSVEESSSSLQEEQVSSSSEELVSSSSEKGCVPQEYKDGVFQTWIGDECNSRVNTGLDNGSGTSGYWFSSSDDGEGGKSKVEWPVELDAGSLDDMGPVVAFCGGVCGTAVLDKGTMTYQPFMSVGFNVAGEEIGGGAPEPADASAWGGLCVSYKMEDVAATIELGLGDVDAAIAYANPNVSLRKSADTTIAVKWSDFKQPSWYKGVTKFSGTDAAKQLVAIKFKIQNAPGKYKFNITSVGPLNGNGDCQPTDK